jgi:N-acylneuraminate cytidylyltransferase
MTTAVAIIPARGGSRRIPRKNIRDFCGKPMIAWSIEAALGSGCFDRVLVSTDDQDIAETARAFGAEVPFMRPAALSDDYTGTTAVVAHAVEWLRGDGEMPDLVCCIYATAPMLRAEDLARGMELLQVSDADFAFSVTTYAFPIQRALRINHAGHLEMFQPQHAATRSQDLEEAWHDAGQFYWGRDRAWLEHESIMTSQALAVKLPRDRVQDIDTLEDWRQAERLFRLAETDDRCRFAE